MGRCRVRDKIFSDSEEAIYQILKSLATRTDPSGFEIPDYYPFTTYRLKIIAETNLDYIKKHIDNLLRHGLIQARSRPSKFTYDITRKGQDALKIYQKQRELLLD
jgi:hypothetical protein